MPDPAAAQTSVPNKADGKQAEKVEAPGSASPAPTPAPTVTPLLNLGEKLPHSEEYLPSILGEVNAWDVYNNEARKVDNELVKDWTASLNSLLVFAAIFAAVLAAFIIESKKLLEQDSAGLMLEVMILFTNNMANGSHTSYTPTDFKPSGIAVSVNCLLFGSLSASLVAALASVIALQWVAEYDAAITRGGSSPEDRAKRRQFRYAGVESWKMGGVIAALPLLLYFSVVLFFAGIIQWMLLLNPTVGYIVIAGAVLVGLFYLSSTIIAVIYVSAPFKSPITRWIYFGYYLTLVIVHWTLVKCQAKSIPPWIESAREGIHTVHKREDLAVIARKDLGYKAMDWLVRQVSISEDSRQRLILLLRHLLEWPSNQLQSRAFSEAPWISIINFLSQKHLENAHAPELTPEEKEDLAVLVNCAALPDIAAMISPSESHNYFSDKSSAQYWNQCCTNNQGQRSTTGSNTPSALFLLVRDLPIPSFQMKDEIKTTARLAKWRNSEPRTPDVWKAVFDKSNTYSDEFFGSLVCLMEAYANSEMAYATAFKMQNLMLSDFAAITQRAVSGNISSNALNSLIRLFERLVSVDSSRQEGPTKKSDGCLRLPLCYAQGLSRRIMVEGVKLSHFSLLFLLVRDLQAHPASERQGRLNDVLTMFWLGGFVTRAYPRNLFEFTLGSLSTMEELHEVVIQNWIHYVDDSKESKEAFRSLLQIFASGTEADGQWLSGCANQSRAHLLSLLKAVDRLVCDDQKTVKKPSPPVMSPIPPPTLQPRSILEILCKMLKTEQFKTCGQRPYTSGNEFVLSTVSDPFVRTIAYRALEISTVKEMMPMYPPSGSPYSPSSQMITTGDYMLWDMHESDPESVWALRAGLISQEASKTPAAAANLFSQVFTTPGRLAFVQKIFDYKTSCTNNSKRGHLLRHLDTHFGIIFTGSDTTIQTINIQNQKFRTVASLLAVSKVEDLSLLTFPANWKIEQVGQVWNYLQSLKDDPPEYLGFLLEILASPMYSGMTYNYSANLGTMAVMLQTIDNGLEYSVREGSFAIWHFLSKRALNLPRPLSYISGPAKGQSMIGLPKVEDKVIQSLVQYGKQVHDKGLSILATTIIYRRRNLRMLSCARPTSGTRPAIGWKPMYID